jgi:hypothetical protein
MDAKKTPLNCTLLSPFVVDLPEVLRQRGARPLHFHRRERKDILNINVIPC